MAIRPDINCCFQGVLCVEDTVLPIERCPLCRGPFVLLLRDAEAMCSVYLNVIISR